jgi:hypothetical protein
MRSPDLLVGRRARDRLAALVLIAVLSGGLTSCGLFDSQVEVLLIGDSIMRQSGEFVEEALEARPDIESVKVKNVGRNGSGLLTPGVYDWHVEAADMIEKYQPDIVVLLFIGNYTSDDLYQQPDGTPVEGYTPAFFEIWGAEAARLTDIVAADGAEVWWVQPPPMVDGELDRRADELRSTYESLAGRRDDIQLIDGQTPLASPDGSYAAELPDENGQLEPVRLADTVHLSAFGGQLLATAIADAIAPSLADDGG